MECINQKQFVDVTEPPFNARGHGKTDDGRAVQKSRRFAGFRDEAFRWTESEGSVSLGPGSFVAYDVSADGSVIVSSGASGAFYWTAETGMLSLQDLLVSLGGALLLALYRRRRLAVATAAMRQ